MKIEGGSASADAPNPSLQLRINCSHQIPLRPARVLKLVDEHVVVARLQPVSAAGELVHLFQQVDRPLEHAGKIEERAGVERTPVLGGGHGKHPPDAARQDDVQIAPKGADGIGNRRRDGRRGGSMLLPGGLRVAMGRPEHGSGESLTTRLAVLGQKIARAAGPTSARNAACPARVSKMSGPLTRLRGRPLQAVSGGRLAGTPLWACRQRRNIRGQQRKLRVAHRASTGGTTRDLQAYPQRAGRAAPPRCGTPTAAVRSRGPSAR